GSCAEPASTSVEKEKTGASGRSQRMSVRPFGSFFTVMRLSNEATSWAIANDESRRKKTVIFRVRCFIRPPGNPPLLAKSARNGAPMIWTGQQGRSSKVRGGKGG